MASALQCPTACHLDSGWPVSRSCSELAARSRTSQPVTGERTIPFANGLPSTAFIEGSDLSARPRGGGRRSILDGHDNVVSTYVIPQIPELTFELNVQLGSADSTEIELTTAPFTAAETPAPFVLPGAFAITKHDATEIALSDPTGGLHTAWLRSGVGGPAKAITYRVVTMGSSVSMAKLKALHAFAPAAWFLNVKSTTAAASTDEAASTFDNDLGANHPHTKDVVQFSTATVDIAVP